MPSLLQGDYVVLASEPVCICGVDCAAPQQLRGRGKARMSVSELKAIFAKQFTPYEVPNLVPVPPDSEHCPMRCPHQHPCDLTRGTGLRWMCATTASRMPCSYPGQESCAASYLQAADGLKKQSAAGRCIVT